MVGAFDVIVVGLGAMGSATAYHLSKQHTKVLGLEAFIPAHDKGSSHGESRIIRQAYFEDPAYVPLVLRAYELWDELQNESNEDILSITGGVAIGSPRRRLITGCLKSARRYGLEHDLLDAREMRRRFPQFALADDEVAFYEEKAGYLKPEECIRQHLRCASKRGADLRFEEPVLSWRASQSGDGVSVTTEKQTYQARSLVISVGPWFAELVPSVSMPVIVSRRVMFWRDRYSERRGQAPIRSAARNKEWTVMRSTGSNRTAYLMMRATTRRSRRRLPQRGKSLSGSTVLLLHACSDLQASLR